MPQYATAEEAVTGLIDAYRSLDIEAIVQSKDFFIDARLFWESNGVPVPTDKLRESADAFETNFRNKLKEEIPDYRDVSFRTISKEEPQDGWTIVTIEGTTAEGQLFRLVLPVFHTECGWKVVLHPGYDHL